MDIDWIFVLNMFLAETLSGISMLVIIGIVLVLPGMCILRSAMKASE